MARKTNTKNIDIARGLLFSDISKTADTAPTTIENSLIKDSPFNKGLSLDTDDLVAAMKTYGFVEPVVVYELPDGTYEMVAGHRRRKAWCEKLGHHSIQAVVLPYDENIESRLSLHSGMNADTRGKSASFWASRIERAEEILQAEEDLTGKSIDPKERTEKICRMIHLSRSSYYRYQGLKKIIPELIGVADRKWATSVTISNASGLNAQQQMKLYEIILQYKQAYDEKITLQPASSLKKPFEITREMLLKFIRSVKEEELGQNREDTVMKKEKQFHQVVTNSANHFIHALNRAATQNEGEIALKLIDDTKKELDRIEEEIRKNFYNR